MDHPRPQTWPNFLEIKKEENIQKIKEGVVNPLIDYTFHRLYPYIMITSIIFYLTFILAVIILYLITKKIIFLYGSFVTGLVLGLIRIMAGGHFLSDIFFAGFFIVILNIILFELYKKYYAK